MCIGDRYRIGEAVFEVTQPRVTCYRAGIRIGQPRMAALLVSHRRPGFYCRVLTEGEVEAGQEIVKVRVRARSSDGRRDRCTALPSRPPSMRFGTRTRIPALSPGWKTSLQSLADQAVGVAGSAGNVGLTAAAQSPPAWTGFRPLQVTRFTTRAGVRSVSFAAPDGNLPTGFPASRSRYASTPRRTGRLRSATTRFPTCRVPRYRISVKRELHGRSAGTSILV